MTDIGRVNTLSSYCLRAPKIPKAFVVAMHHKS